MFSICSNVSSQKKSNEKKIASDQTYNNYPNEIGKHNFFFVGKLSKLPSFMSHKFK